VLVLHSLVHARGLRAQQYQSVFVHRKVSLRVGRTVPLLLDEMKRDNVHSLQNTDGFYRISGISEEIIVIKNVFH